MNELRQCVALMRCAIAPNTLSLFQLENNLFLSHEGGYRSQESFFQFSSLHTAIDLIDFL
jgi:hypothetical protein